MIVTCPNCATRYLVEDAALGSVAGRRMRCASFATVVASISSSVGMTIPNCFSNPSCSSTSINESIPRSSSDLSTVSFAGAIPTMPATCGC